MIVSRRHKKLGVKTRLFRKITEIPPEEWNRVYPNVLESYDYFKTLDEAGLDQFSLFYLMAYKGKEPVAATTCFLLNYSLDTSINGPMRRITNAVRKHLPNIFNIKAIVCGVPITDGKMGLAGRSDEILNAIVRRLERMAKKNRAAVIAFKDFGQAYTKILDPLKKTGFARFDSLPGTVLDVRFKNFEEYLAALSSANRYDLRRKFKKVDGRVKIDMEIADDLDQGTLNEVYKLYLDIVAKHDMGFELLTVDFFRDITRNMPGRAKYFLWRIDGKLAAFLLFLVSEDTLIDYYVGLDYSIAHQYHLYFVKFRDTLNWCIKNNIKRYEMGITGYEPKRRLGFTFLPQYLYVKLRSRAFRPVFNFICQFLRFENFDPALRKAKEKEKDRVKGQSR